MDRLDESRCGGAFERESVADLSHNAFLQRLYEVGAGVAARNFRSVQVEGGQLTSPSECFTIRHKLGNHSSFVGGERRQRLWIQQECLRPSGSGAVTPSCKDSVTRNKSTGQSEADH